LYRLPSIFCIGALLALAELSSWPLPRLPRGFIRGANTEFFDEGSANDERPIAQPLPQNSQSPAPSDAEIHDRGEKLIENQHRDDVAIEQYERIEHQVDRTAGPNPRVLEDKLYRVVPTGTGTMKILLKENNKLTDPVLYKQQLQTWRELLELALKPDDSRAKLAYAKWQKKKTDREQLVDATREAFLTKWIGQEMVNGRLCDVLELNPNSSFHPHTIFQDAMTHVTAKIWVDNKKNQLARAEAHVRRDMAL